MGILFDKKTDVLYQEGVEQGIEQGIAQGKRELITEMLRDGTLTMEKIASLAKVPVAHVQEIAKTLRK